jgi:transposase
MTDDRLNVLPPDLRDEFVAYKTSLETSHRQLNTTNRSLVYENNLLREELRLLRAYRFGRSSEKLVDGQTQLFDTEEVTAPKPQDENSEEAGKTKTKKKPRPNHPGRHPFPEHMERVIEEVPLSPEERSCTTCGKEMKTVGTQSREELEEVPAKLRVRVFETEVCKCAHCTAAPVVAEAPDRLIPGGSAGPSIWSRVIVDKFVDHQPLNRQEARFARENIYLSRKTLCGWLKQLHPFLHQIVACIREDLLAGGYLQADETPTPMQTREKTGKNHTGYFWVYSRPHGPVFFDFQTGRSRVGPAKLLEYFKGILQHDGWQAYLKLNMWILHVACMAHIRRKFFEAEKAKDPRARKVVRAIGRLYKIERLAKAEGFNAEQRHDLRQKRSVKRMALLKKRILRLAEEATPASALGKACAYALGQWTHMENYLTDGRIEIDNNLVENAIRPVTLGRKNWMHLGSELGGEMAATYLTLVSNCKRLEINPREYLEDVLTRLPNHCQTRLAELTPAAWKAEQAEKAQKP